jgi:predicted outer membrane repeat protein
LYTHPNFIENSAGVGGGVACDNDSTTFSRCLFISNNATFAGALYSASSPTPKVSFSTFSENEATEGGGIYCHSSSPVIENSIISFSDNGGAVCRSSGNPVFTCCNIFGNIGGDWSGFIADQYGTNGNISEDPLFCGDDNTSDPYTLHTDSPCDSSNNPGCGQIGARPTACTATIIAHWTFEECSGDTLFDTSGNNNHGVIYGGANWVAGYDGCALSFDGSNDYVEIGNTNILPQGEEFTINVWAKFHSIYGDHTILDKRTSAGSDQNVVKIGIQDDYSPDALQFITTDTTHVWTDVFYPVTNLDTTRWFMITAVYDNEDLRFYINGNPVGENSASLPLNSTDAPLWLGANNKSGDYNRFAGLLDEITIYSRALTEYEIKRLDSTLIAYYPFDNHAVDESGNENHGTISGAAGVADRFNDDYAALHFEGNGDKVVIDNVDILPQGEIFTVSLWANFNALTGDHTILDKRDLQSSDQNVLKLMIQDGYDHDVLDFETRITIFITIFAFF